MSRAEQFEELEVGLRSLVSLFGSQMEPDRNDLLLHSVLPASPSRLPNGIMSKKYTLSYSGKIVI
jgi:hypothetical protein